MEKPRMVSAPELHFQPALAPRCQQILAYISARNAPTTVALKWLGQTAASWLDHVTETLHTRCASAWMLTWDAAALHRREENIRTDETGVQGNYLPFFSQLNLSLWGNLKTYRPEETHKSFFSICTDYCMVDGNILRHVKPNYKLLQRLFQLTAKALKATDTAPILCRSVTYYYLYVFL